MSKWMRVLFYYILDFKDIVQKWSHFEIVESINQIIIDFDQSTDKSNVFKVCFYQN
jgi:hypothetical protein